ncbi:MAG: sorbosone dehydrogenase [Myxococcales bacterium]|nr:sorbosone dehydrogenase [Myxococcales bacterium]
MRTTSFFLGLGLAGVTTLGACGDDNGNSPPAPDAAVADAPPVAVTCAADNGGLTLPTGFCATIFADHVGKARHIAVTPMGRVFVAVQPSMPTATDGHVLALYDADNDGVAEDTTTFGTFGGNGIAWQDGVLYLAADDRIVRFNVPDGRSTPTSPTPSVIVGNLPAEPDHTAKTVVVRGASMFVNIGSASNACQVKNRELHSPGVDPCPELETRAGIWQFSLATTNIDPIGTRVATGVRNGNALAIDPASDTLWAAVNGRDQLHENWPEQFTVTEDNLRPSEELVAIKPGVDRGWPYCYHDPVARQMKLAPEYGGDGEMQGRCATIAEPPVAIPAHAAPLAIAFARGTQFPAAYRNGVFIANHGSRFDTDAAAADLHGYDVQFASFADGQPTGSLEKFATGFDAGMRPLPDAAPHRPVGLAMMPDGSLLIGDDKGGRIWRVFYKAP